MPIPDYEAPATLDEALKLLGRAPAGVHIIAGGTDLIPRIRSGVFAPQQLIDLIRLPLSGIRQETGFVYLGARITHTQVLQSELLNNFYPALTSACAQIGGPSIRNRGTLGGNLVNGSPAADAALPLLIYDADLLLVKEGSERWLPLAEFFLSPGQTALAGDEILKEIRLPLPPPRTAAIFLKMGRRQAMAIAVVGIVVRLTVNNRAEIAQARIALGSVAPRPIRATLAEQALLGRPLPELPISEVASLASGQSSPISDIRGSAAYRRRMVQVLVRRALMTTRLDLQQELAGG